MQWLVRQGRKHIQTNTVIKTDCDEMQLCIIMLLPSFPAVPGFDSFYANFIDANNPNNTEADLSSPSIQKTLRPNASLDDTRRLFTMSDGSDQNVLNLTSSGVFQTSTSIGGVYMCLANNSFGSRNATVNITVKSEPCLHHCQYIIIIMMFPSSCKRGFFCSIHQRHFGFK